MESIRHVEQFGQSLDQVEPVGDRRIEIEDTMTSSATWWSATSGGKAQSKPWAMSKSHQLPRPRTKFATIEGNRLQTISTESPHRRLQSDELPSEATPGPGRKVPVMAGRRQSRTKPRLEAEKQHPRGTRRRRP